MLSLEIKLVIENVRSIRPGFGLHPKFLNDLLNREFKEDYKKGTPMSFEYCN